MNEELFNLLLEAPDTQLDKSMKDYLKSLKDKSKEEIRDGLKYILDQSCNGGLASDFTMRVLQYEWLLLVEETK